ncbi:MAG: helix-turn-helix domain-containing protein [Nitrososphaerota archaeon]|nr:helix-turn-helix domain-containing protein [Nitrososphaerota archaeon]
MLAEGLTQREVAEQTGWSEHTVRRAASSLPLIE